MKSTLRWAPMLLTTACALVGCNAGDESPDLSQLIDADGDGYFVNDPDPAAADCDDREGIGQLANPGGREVCDGLDNDCNGTVDDDDAEGGVPYYTDEDGDGYGVRWPDGEDRTACAVPKRFAANRRDCNDSDGLIFPQAPERCNELDDDCDSQVDEGFDPTAIWHLDSDGDGFGGVEIVGEGCAFEPNWTRDDQDCNDVMGAVNPNATEVCDGFDNDCDGLVDIADDSVTNTRTWFADLDGDGDGDILNTTQTCGYTDLSANGWVLNNVDCNDNNPAQNRNTIWYVDADRDGFGTPGATWPTPQCHQPIGHALNTNDCDDANSAEWRGRLWYADADGDGFGAGPAVWQGCGASTGHVANNLDCDDRSAERNPEAIEICDGGIDNDCNGAADDDDVDAVGKTIWYIDNDGDSWGIDLQRVQACAQPEGFAARNGDCDDFNPEFTPETQWYRDADRDGYGNPNEVWPAITCNVVPGHVPNNLDCDDTDFYLSDHTRWWTDNDGDALGAGVTPAFTGCVSDTTGLADWTGDCNDNDSLDDAGGCFGPQLGNVVLNIDTTNDFDPANNTFLFECLVPGTPPTLEEFFRHAVVGNSTRYTVYDLAVPDAIAEGRQCRARRLYTGSDTWGDGTPIVNVYACGQFVTTIAGNVVPSAPSAVFSMPSCSGCTDPLAENYDPNAIVSTNADACIYPL